MQLKKIKVDHWYNTKHGVGRCLKVGGTFPVSVCIDILLPFPIGKRFMAPREVLAEVEPPDFTKEPPR